MLTDRQTDGQKSMFFLYYIDVFAQWPTDWAATWINISVNLLRLGETEIHFEYQNSHCPCVVRLTNCLFCSLLLRLLLLEHLCPANMLLAFFFLALMSLAASPQHDESKAFDVIYQGQSDVIHMAAMEKTAKFGRIKLAEVKTMRPSSVHFQFDDERGGIQLLHMFLFTTERAQSSEGNEEKTTFGN